MVFGSDDGWQACQLVIVRDKNKAKRLWLAKTCLLCNTVPIVNALTAVIAIIIANMATIANIATAETGDLA